MFKNNILIIFITLSLTFLLNSSDVFAQVPQPATGPYKISTIKTACYAITSNGTRDSAELSMAEGICAGAISTTMRLGPKMSPEFRFCPPPSLSVKDVVPYLKRFIDKNPNINDYDIRDAVNYLGRITWPCI